MGGNMAVFAAKEAMERIGKELHAEPITWDKLEP
jgi:hypothetical protein